MQRASPMLEWNQALSVGIEGIDLQHRYFVDLIGRLSVELEGKDPAYRTRLINELGSYAQLHFVCEENLMYKLGFPGLESHRKSHRALLEKLNGQIGLYLVGLLDAGEITDSLASWLVHHISTEDREIGVFVNQVELQ